MSRLASLVTLALLAPTTALAEIPSPPYTWPVPPLAPAELSITSVIPGCEYGYQPLLVIGVTNTGDVAASTRIDVFSDLPSAPTVGDEGLYLVYADVPAGHTVFVTVYLYPSHYGAETWFDVIVDTDRWVPESIETNNVYSTQESFSDCPRN